MKKALCIVLVAVALSGCAANAYKQARANANQVRNGMTMAEVVQILGLPPTVSNNEYAYWRRGKIENYNGTVNGAIRFDFKDGRVINVPEGGIFNPKTAAEYEQKRQAEFRRLAAVEQAERDRILSEGKIECPDRVTCAKIFSLAQVYVTNVSDQKIQVVTDTVVQTYNPTDPGRIGMTVVRLPTAGDAEQISITPTCRGFANGVKPPLCDERIEAIYRGFKPFIEVHLGTIKKPATGAEKRNTGT